MTQLANQKGRKKEVGTWTIKEGSSHKGVTEN